MLSHDTGVEERGVDVNFIDYGNTDVVLYDEVYQLPLHDSISTTRIQV